MIKEKLAKLLCVKSIVTIILTAVFAYLAVVGAVSADQFLTVFTVIIAFYFGTQYERKVAVAATATESSSSKEAQGAAN